MATLGDADEPESNAVVTRHENCGPAPEDINHMSEPVEFQNSAQNLMQWTVYSI
jgi:hypothetical protein